MKSIKRRLDNLVSRAKQDKQILAVLLFGSSARAESSDESDLDICLIINEDLSMSGREIFQKRLSYLKNFDMDIQIFQQLPLYIRVRVIREGQILFCRNEDKLYEAVFHTLREFADFEHIYREYLREVANA